MKKGTYKITNISARRQVVSVGGEAYEFESGETKTLSLYPYEMERFDLTGGALTVVEIEAGVDPTKDEQKAALEDAEAAYYYEKQMGLR